MIKKICPIENFRPAFSLKKPIKNYGSISQKIISTNHKEFRQKYIKSRKSSTGYENKIF